MKTRSTYVAPILVAALGAVGLWGCSRNGDTAEARGGAPFDSSGGKFGGTPNLSDTTQVAARAAMSRAAICTLDPTQGGSVHGTVTFREVTGGVRVVADVTGLTPGKHGFHVHENGDCSAPDAMSAGGHFSTTPMPHGGPDSAKRHTGDLGNLTADQKGVAHYDRTDDQLTLDGPGSIVGKAIIVHAGGDDLTSQPSGNSGARVACGVIRPQMGGAPSDSMGGSGMHGSQPPDSTRAK